MLLENLTDIKQRIAAAASRANRSAADITMVAVTKQVPLARIRQPWHFRRVLRGLGQRPLCFRRKLRPGGR